MLDFLSAELNAEKVKTTGYVRRLPGIDLSAKERALDMIERATSLDRIATVVRAAEELSQRGQEQRAIALATA